MQLCKVTQDYAEVLNCSAMLMVMPVHPSSFSMRGPGLRGPGRLNLAMWQTGHSQASRVSLTTIA